MSETATQPATGVVWFEVPAGDSERARSFYGGLFGWAFQPFGDQDYHVSESAGGAIVGAPGQKGVMAYFGVQDMDAALAQVRELGGEAGEKLEIPGVGLYAQCTDTEGNAFGLYQDAPA